MQIQVCIPPRPGQDLRDWIHEMRESGKSREEIYAGIQGKYEDAGKIVEKVDKDRDDKAESEDDSLQKILDRLQLIVLTKDARGKTEVYSKQLKQRAEIHDVGRLSYPRLIQIAGGRLVKKHIQEGSEDSQRSTLRDVRQAIGSAASSKNESSVQFRGSGIWKSGNDLVICDRESMCVWNGSFRIKETPIHDGYFYESHLPGSWFDSKEFSRLKPDPIETVDECKEVVGRWRWDCEDAPEAVAGLILSTWVQLVWSWRPQVVITGKKGSGKSIFFQMLENLFGGLADNQSDSTLAGIVSSIENSGVIVLLDELDSNPERPKIFRMIKRAGRGARRRTGTAAQKSIETTAKQMFWFAGIDSGLERDTETERFVKLNLLPKIAGAARITEPSESLCNALGRKLMKLAVINARNAARKAVELAATDFGVSVPDRVVETYAVPAAILAEVTGQPGREILVRILENEARKKMDSQSDEDALRDAILGAHVQVGQGVGTLSVRQLADRVIEAMAESTIEVSADEIHVAALEKVGIRLTDSEFLISHTQASRHLLQKTSFRDRSVKEIFLTMGFIESRKRNWRHLKIKISDFLGEESFLD